MHTFILGRVHRVFFWFCFQPMQCIPFLTPQRLSPSTNYIRCSCRHRLLGWLRTAYFSTSTQYVCRDWCSKATKIMMLILTAQQKAKLNAFERDHIEKPQRVSFREDSIFPYGLVVSGLQMGPQKYWFRQDWVCFLVLPLLFARSRQFTPSLGPWASSPRKQN